MLTFVLVHGGWHDGSCWEYVVDHLEELGHKAHAPTIAGNGKNADRRVTHADCTASIVNYIVDNDLRDFVLVGHSYGGTVIAKVAEAIPDRIQRLVFWSAFVLHDGQSLFDETPQNVAVSEEGARKSGDDTFLPPFEAVRDVFFNSCSREDAQRYYQRWSPQPMQPFRDKLDMKKFHGLSIRKSYLVRTYAWMVLLGNRGPVVAALKAIGWEPAPLLLFTRFSSTVALIHILLPIMVMTLYAAMKKIDPNLMRAASGLGATSFAAFRSVYLPLSAPGIVSGSTIVFVLCIGFYVTPVLIGSPREQMIAGVIGNRIEEFLAFGEASAIAMVLLAVTLLILGIYHRFFGLDRLWG